jgi:hypothetical protein
MPGIIQSGHSGPISNENRCVSTWLDCMVLWPIKMIRILNYFEMDKIRTRKSDTNVFWSVFLHQWTGKVCHWGKLLFSATYLMLKGRPTIALKKNIISFLHIVGLHKLKLSTSSCNRFFLDVDFIENHIFSVFGNNFLDIFFNNRKFFSKFQARSKVINWNK